MMYSEIKLFIIYFVGCQYVYCDNSDPQVHDQPPAMQETNGKSTIV